MNGRNLILFLFCIIFMFPLYCAAKAHRIVSLSPAMTELICVLGAEKELVGRSSVCDYPATIRTVPVAGDFANPNLEKILALMPDIVVTNDLINPSVEKVLRARKIQVQNLPCKTLTEYAEAVTKLSIALDRQEEGEREKARMEHALREFKSLPKQNSTVLTLIWDVPIVIAAGNTVSNEFLEIAGVRGLDFLGRTGYFTPDKEWLMSVKADMLQVFKDPAAIKKHPVLQKMDAVRQDRIFYFQEPSLLQRPGPRWSEGVRMLRKMLEDAEMPPEIHSQSEQSQILMEFRFWRTVAAFLIGSALSIAGLVFQTIFRNPLATPYTLGISGGSAAGAALMFVFCSSGALVWLVPTGAFAGAMLTLALVLFISGFGRCGTDHLLQSGVIAGTILSSLLVYLISIADSDQLAGVTWWMLGDLQTIEPAMLKTFSIFLIAAVLMVRWFANDLNAMSLGDETAKTLGVRLFSVRLILVILASLLASFCVAQAGIIGFVGLIVPHLVRRMAGSNLRKTVIPTFFAGGFFLIFCDFASRFIDPVRQTPIGVLTSCIGGGLFLLLQCRRKGGSPL